MSGLRPDVFERMREMLLENEDVAQVMSLRASNGGRLRDGIMMTGYTPEFICRNRFHIPGGEHDYVPVAIALYQDRDKPDSDNWCHVTMDVEDLKQLVNQAQVLIADVERAMGRIGDDDGA